MFLFISAICPFDYDATVNSKKWDGTAEMRKRRIMLKAKRYFSTAESFYSNQGAFGENALNDTSRKTSLMNKRERRYAHEVRILNLEDPEVVSLATNKVRTE